MKDLLIVFIVMLLLLIVISTLGGSVYPKESFFQEKELEPFWEEQQKYEEKFSEMPPSAELPVGEPTPLPTPTAETPVVQAQQEEDVVEGFDGDQWATV